MNIVTPAPLRKGDVIGIVAPGSPPAPDLLGKGIRYLERLGYRIEVGYHVYQQNGYLAGYDRERASDIHRMFAHPMIKAVFCARGGFGSARLLPYLDFAMIRKHPKILVGYSDITALQSALFELAGLVTFSGPMVAVEFGGQFGGKAEELFWRMITSPKRLAPVSLKPVFRPARELKPVTGRLVGGNLSVFSSLAGTPYLPSSQELLCILEEIDERPYRIDRMLTQLRLAGLFKRTTGIVLGNFTECAPETGKPSLSLHEIISSAFDMSAVPVMGNLRYGHVRNSLPLPFGVRARIHPSAGKLEFLDPAVRTA